MREYKEQIENLQQQSPEIINEYIGSVQDKTKDYDNPLKPHTNYKEIMIQFFSHLPNDETIREKIIEIFEYDKNTFLDIQTDFTAIGYLINYIVNKNITNPVYNKKDMVNVHVYFERLQDDDVLFDIYTVWFNVHVASLLDENNEFLLKSKVESFRHKLKKFKSKTKDSDWYKKIYRFLHQTADNLENDFYVQLYFSFTGIILNLIVNGSSNAPSESEKKELEQNLIHEKFDFKERSQYDYDTIRHIEKIYMFWNENYNPTFFYNCYLNNTGIHDKANFRNHENIFQKYHQYLEKSKDIMKDELIYDISKIYGIPKVGIIDTYIDLNAIGCLMNLLINYKFRDPFIFQKDLKSIESYVMRDPKKEDKPVHIYKDWISLYNDTNQ